LNNIFFSDLDGTLLQKQNGKYTVSEEDILAIKNYQEAGNEFVIATGRHAGDIKALKLHYGIKTNYYISNNGACVWENDERIYSQDINKEIAQEIIKFGVENGYYVSFSDGKKLYLDNSMNGHKTETHLTFDPVIFVDDLLDELKKHNHVVSIGFSPCLTDEMNLALKEAITLDLFNHISNKYTDQVEAYFSGIDKSYMDFMHKGVSKGSAIQWLLNKVEHSWTHVSAAGDAMNDYHMLKYADTGYMMSNGHKELKEVSDKIIDRVYEGLDEVK